MKNPEINQNIFESHEWSDVVPDLIVDETQMIKEAAQNLAYNSQSE